MQHTTITKHVATYHQTVIATRDTNTSTTVKLCHGGWVTATTARRLNQVLVTWKLPGSVYRRGGRMYYSRCVDVPPVEIQSHPTTIETAG